MGTTLARSSMENLNLIVTADLRNAEHHMFMTELNEGIKTATPEELSVSDIYPEFNEALKEEDAVMKVELGSSKSKILKELDKKRDKTWNSIKRRTESTLICPIEAEVKAAEAINRVLNTYGDIRQRSYKEETDLMDNLLADLLSPVNSPHLVTMSMEHWVEGLKTENSEFKLVLNQRNIELANRIDGNVYAVRTKIDPLYQKLVNRINATIELKLAKPAAEVFVKECNENIRYYENAIAIRNGRAAEEALPPK